MSETKHVLLSDGRSFSGQVVLDGPDHLDLVWTDQGVNHQVSIPKDQVSKTNDAGFRLADRLNVVGVKLVVHRNPRVAPDVVGRLPDDVRIVGTAGDAADTSDHAFYDTDDGLWYPVG